jgi:hypothetical protein
MIKLSIHMPKRVAERALDLVWIEATIASPDWVRPDKNPSLTRPYQRITAFGNRILRVVHRPNGLDVLVVTAFFDRNAKP